MSPEFSEETVQKLSFGADLAEAERFFVSKKNRVFVFDAAKTKTKKELLAVLAAELEFPRFFGFNWDALEDSLKNLAYSGKSPGYVLIFKNSAQLLKNSQEELEIFIDILKEASKSLRENHDVALKILLA